MTEQEIERLLDGLPEEAQAATYVGGDWDDEVDSGYMLLERDQDGRWTQKHMESRYLVQRGRLKWLVKSSGLLVDVTSPVYDAKHAKLSREAALRAAREYLGQAEATGEDPLGIVVPNPTETWEFELKWTDEPPQWELWRARRAGSRGWVRPWAFPSAFLLRFSSHTWPATGESWTAEEILAVAHEDIGMDVAVEWQTPTRGLIQVSAASATPGEVREAASRITPETLVAD